MGVGGEGEGLKFQSCFVNSCSLRLLRTFAGALGKKIRMRAILKENTANYISLESLINVDFGKKYKLQVSSILQKKIAINRENDHVSFS